MTLKSSRSKLPTRMLHTPRGPNFREFCSMMSHFLSYSPIFRKVHQNAKWPWHIQGQKYQHACYTHTRGPNFRPFRSTMSRFWVMVQFSEKCTEWPKMTLTCSRSKIKTYMLHTPHEAQIFVSFALQWAVFEFGKVQWMTPNDLDMFKVKNSNIHATSTPGPKFSSVDLYDEPFSSKLRFLNSPLVKM